MTIARQGRREFNLGICAAVLGASAALSRHGLASPATPTVEQRRLANRLELWSTYSERSDTLVARYHCTRWSSLLEAPLEVDGQLLFIAPDILVLRDEGFSGSTTRIDSTQVRVSSNQSTPIGVTDAASGGEGEASGGASRVVSLASQRHFGMVWTAKRLVRLFAPGPAQQLIEAARHEVPRGRSPRLTLRPLRDEAARLEIRDLTLTLDPVGGAPLRIEIAQTQGDRHRMDFADHRQGLPQAEVEAMIARA